MSTELSPQSEQYLASMVAGGLFSTEEAALEAAVEALRAQNCGIPFVPEEHMARVEEALEQANAGQLSATNPAYWEELRRNVGKTAGENQAGA